MIIYTTLSLLVLSVVIIGCGTSNTKKSVPPISKVVSTTTPSMPQETPTPITPEVEPTPTNTPFPTPANTPFPTPSQDSGTIVYTAIENLEQLHSYLGTWVLEISFSGGGFYVEMPVEFSFAVESERVMSYELSMKAFGEKESISGIQIGDDVYSKENDSPWKLEPIHNLDSDEYWQSLSQDLKDLLSYLEDGYSPSLTQTMSGNEYTIAMDYIPELIVEFIEGLEYDARLLKGTTKYSIDRSSSHISNISFVGIPFSVKDDTMGEVNVEVNASFTFSDWNNPTIKITAPDSFIDVREMYSGPLTAAPAQSAVKPSSPKSSEEFSNLSFDISDPIELPEEVLVVADGWSLVVYDVLTGSFFGPSDPVKFGWVNTMDSSTEGDLFVSFNTSDSQQMWGDCEYAGCTGILKINTNSFSKEKGFNDSSWLIGGPYPNTPDYEVLDVLYHNGKLYVATNSEEHMVQVIGTKTGSHLGQIDLPQFHPAALTLSLDSQDIFIVPEGDSKSIVPMQIHSLTV